MMIEQNFLPQTSYLGQFTFYGIFKEFHKDCEVMYRKNGWAQATDEQYEKIITKTICPHLVNHNIKGIIEYSRKDFDDALDNIQADYKKQTGSEYDESTMRTFRRLIRTVVTVAYNNGKTFFNVYEEDDSADTKKKELLRYHSSRNIQPKSLSPDEEYRLTRYLTDNLRNDGIYLGLLLMLATGARCEEICGANFEDVVVFSEYPDFYCLRILHTTSINSSMRKMTGKTQNSYRYIPIPRGMYEIIQTLYQEREACLASDPGYNKNETKYLPLVCKGKDYLRRCESGDLSRAGRDAFLAIGIRREYLTSIALHLQQEQSAAEELSPEIRFNQAKKDATTYLLRRNFATHLRLLPLREAEVHYLMAHKIEDPKANRRDYSNPDYLYPIKQKLDLRPIMNPLPATPPAIVLSKNQSTTFQCGGSQSIVIPPDTYGIVNAFSGAPNTSINCEISSPCAPNIIIHNIPRSVAPNTSTDIDIALNEYWDVYRSVIGDYVVHI